MIDDKAQKIEALKEREKALQENVDRFAALKKEDQVQRYTIHLRGVQEELSKLGAGPAQPEQQIASQS